MADAPTAVNPANFRAELVALMPNLRAFARSLCPNPARADDLVQETLVKALSNTDRFQAGTNLRAWLFTILRNTYYSELRKSRREVEDQQGELAASLASAPSQNSIVDLDDFRRAFAHLNEDHRVVLTLVGALGMPYEEAAEICGCAVGTVKSRVNRARKRLAELLGMNEDDDMGGSESDRLPQGVIAGSW